MNRIKELRQKEGWRQKDLEAKLNLGRGNISKYEKEDRSLSPEIICKLCDLFNVSADYLLCRNDLEVPKISEADKNLLAAFHKADPNIKTAIQLMLAPYKEEKGIRSSTA